MIIAKPAHTMPRIRAEKLRGAPGGREARSDWHKGLTWLPKPCPSHMRPTADVHHLAALPTAVQAASALPKPRKTHLLLVHDVSHPEWMGNPGQEKQPKKDLFPVTDGGGWQDGLQQCHRRATPSITLNVLPGCFREGSGDEVPPGDQPCHRKEAVEEGMGFSASPPCAPQLRDSAAGQSGPTVGCDAPSPMPEFSRTPQENHMAEERVRASSSSSSLFTLNRPNGLENKTESSSHIPSPGSQASLLCPKCPDGALHHSSLQTVPMSQTALHPSWPTTLLIRSPVQLTLVLFPPRFSPGQKDHLIQAISSLSHRNTEG